MKSVHLAIAVMCLVWGSTWFVLREGLEEMEPFGSAALRFLLAWLIILPVARVLNRRGGGAAPGWDLVLVMATGNIALSFAIVYWAEQVVPSGLAAVLWAVFPIMTALVGHVAMPEQRIVGLQWLGLLVGFAGVALLFVTDLAAARGDATFRATILLLSPLVSAIATAYVKKHGRDVSSVLLNRAAYLVGGGMLLVMALVFEGGVSLPTSSKGALSLVYLSAIGTVLAFTLYFWVLRTASPLSLSLITYVTPAIALLIGTQVGDERISTWTFVGLGLVLAGCALVLRKGRAGALGAAA